MRLSNRNRSSFYSFINSFWYILLLTGIILYIVEEKRFQITSGWYSLLLILIPLLLLAFHQLRGRQIFEYDSDGEALNFKNRHVLPIISRSSSDEFPKYKLQKFDIINLPFFKRLYITVSSKKTNAVTLKYDISYLASKEVQDLRFSLNKVIKNNKENKTTSQ